MEQFNLPERICFARIEKKPVNYYQRVCWYYNELNEEARKFIDVYIKKAKVLNPLFQVSYIDLRGNVKILIVKSLLFIQH